MEEAPLESVPSFAPLPKRKINKRFIYLVFAVIVIILIFLGFKNFSSGKKESVDQGAFVTTPTLTPTETPTLTLSPTPSLTPTLTPTKTPTPKPTSSPIDSSTGLDRSKLSVTVENGSGEGGVAGKGSDYLKGLGYDVTGTGNADNFNYTNVTIQVKSANSDFLDLLKKDLGFNYTIQSATSDLPDSFSTDALVIIGK
ncbi:MAG TPA: LytR C-terminal domain-containing protein [Candidatus Sulfotelmatobacter sp.]|nr:LytR C-terminal domain-containing protein [Candidatus Sulfotelmatobacter sp.]